jgi:hypothetical protein
VGLISPCTTTYSGLLYGKTGGEKRSACRRDSDEVPLVPHKKLGKSFQIAYVNSIRSSSVAARPLLRSAVGVQKFEIINGLEPVVHADNEHGSVDEGEQVAEHSSVGSSRDGDSETCPVCLDTFTTQDIGTPDVCNHKFYVACLQRWSENKNICPVHR